MSEEKNDPTRTETPSVAGSAAGMAAAEHPAKSTVADSAATAAADSRSPGQKPVEKPVEKPAEKSGGGLSLALGVLVAIAVLAGGAYVTRDKWLPAVGPMVGYAPHETTTATATATEASPREASPAKVVAGEPSSLSPDAMAAQIDSLTARLSAMEESVGELRQSIDKLATEATASRALAATVTAIGERVTKLERTSGDISQLQRDFGDLSKRAIALRDGYSGLNATVLAANQLARAVDDGVPYTRPLAAVRSIAGDDKEIAAVLAKLEPHAATGIPTFAALRAQFPAVADAVARSAPTIGRDEWYYRALDKVISLVTIRTTGATAAHAGGVDATLAEAETALNSGDLAAAVSVMGGLEGTAAAPAADWLKSAELRLDAIEAISRLQEQAAMRLAQARG